jgi:hypothetical protein
MPQASPAVSNVDDEEEVQIVAEVVPKRVGRPRRTPAQTAASKALRLLTQKQKRAEVRSETAAAKALELLKDVTNLEDDDVDEGARQQCAGGCDDRSGLTVAPQLLPSQSHGLWLNSKILSQTQAKVRSDAVVAPDGIGV